MLRAYVVGHPVAHSLSPAIYTFFAQKLALLDFVYRRKDVPPDSLVSFLDDLTTRSDVIGINVTVPHKSSILSLLDELTPEAKQIGAVNVVHQEGHRWMGHNTDAAGFYHVLHRRAFPLLGAKVLLLGAGGAARAVMHVLVREGVAQVDIINRSALRAQELVRDFSQSRSQHAGISPTQMNILLEHCGPYDLCIQATSLGLHHQTDQESQTYFMRVLKGIQFQAHGLAFDLVYPGQSGVRLTPFLQTLVDQRLRQSITQVDGLEMLVEQAAETWRIWFNQSVESSLRLDLVAFLRERPIFLTGFMGVGKSTVGALLAQEWGYQWIDLDHEIEKETGCSIAEIFQQGEFIFREIEHRVFLRHVWTPRAVIALGGGSLTHSGTRRILRALGRSVYLSASTATLQERLGLSHERPLLKKATQSQPQTIEALLASREKHYLEATVHVQTDHLTPQQVVQNVRILK